MINLSVIQKALAVVLIVVLGIFSCQPTPLTVTGEEVVARAIDDAKSTTLKMDAARLEELLPEIEK